MKLKLSFALFSFAFFMIGCTDKSKYITEEEELIKIIKKKKHEILENLNYIDIHSVDYPKIEGENPSKTYLIKSKIDINENIYFFNGEEYTHENSLKTGGNPENKGDIKDICDFIYILKKQEYKKRSIPNIIKTKISIPTPIGEFTVENLEDFIWNKMLAIDILIDVPVKKINILVKGYADGQKNKWCNPLSDNKHYRYESIDIHKITEGDKGRDEPIYYEKQSTKITIDSVRNSTLPNLRSKYIVENFISKMCDPHENLEIIILEGHEYLEDDEPEKRTVQIFIQYFL